MRLSNHRVPRRTLATATLALVLTACSSAVPSVAPSPTVAPTPVITPDPHLTEPATADAIFIAITSAGMPLSGTNAIGGDPNSPIVKRINATLESWPLMIIQYKNSATLRAAAKWDPTKPAPAGSPPYVFVGLNILVDFGPASAKPAAPDPSRQEQAQRLAGVLDALLWPLEQRSVTPIATRTPPPPSADPVTTAASPRPTAKP